VADANEAMMALLAPEERSRWKRLRRAADRDHYLVGRAMTRMALFVYLDRLPQRIAISCVCGSCGGDHGKPRLAESSAPEVEFSISHSGAHVLVAFGRRAALAVIGPCSCVVVLDASELLVAAAALPNRP
jgi:4'-phosphopantetheinyl transferase